MYRNLVFIAALCAACFARAQTGSVISVGEYVAGEDWTGEQLAPVAVLATNTAVALTNLEERVAVLETNQTSDAVSWGALTNTGVGTIVADGVNDINGTPLFTFGGENTSWTAFSLAAGLYEYPSGRQWLPSWTIADILTNHVAGVASGLTGLVSRAAAAGSNHTASVASGLTGLVSAAAVSGTGYVDSVAGTLPSYTAVSNIAASAQGLLGTYYGYGSVASDLAGYYMLSNAFSAVGTYHAITNAGVTNLQYVGQFATPNSRITAQPKSTAHVKFWAGINPGGGRAASVNVELYVLTTNGTAIVEWAGLTPVTLGALTYCEFDVDIPTNLVYSQIVRYSTKVKVVSQANNPTIYIFSEDGRPFQVELPLSSGQFAFQSDLDALDVRLDNIVAPAPAALTATNLLLLPFAGGRSTLCSNAAFTAVFDASAYQTGKVNWIEHAIDWRTNGLTTLVWPTNIVWQASTNAPAFTHGKRYFIFGSNYGDGTNGTWWMSTSGAY